MLVRGTRGPAVTLLAAGVVAIVVTTLPGSAGADQARKDARWSPDRWQRALSEPTFPEIESSIHYIDADDGAQLSLTLHLPGPLAEGRKVPTLLQITPYQGFLRNPTVGPPPPTREWEFFIQRGAAYVEADARGSNASDGCLDFGGSIDRADARSLVKWIRSQSWSNGVVVTDGVSHPGMGSVVAHAAVPNLTAALAHAPVVSYYQDEWLQGAKFEDQFNGPLYQVVDSGPPRYATPESLQAQVATCTGDTTRDFSSPEGTFTDLWVDRDLSRHVPKERIPILLTHGFVDLNVHPDHSQLYWDALPENYPKFAIFGWWYHGYPDLTGHAFLRFDFVRHRWLDTMLFGIDNGLGLEPRVLVEDSTGAWHEGHDWPLEPSEKAVFYPAADGRLASTTPKNGALEYQDAVGAQRGYWDGASAVFRTAPLTRDRLVNGAPEVRLSASSSVAETKWVAYLIDEAPDGTWQRVSHGYADSHTWAGEDKWQTLEPGRVYKWGIKLMPTAVVVAKGHRLVLVIASQDSRRVSPQSRCFSDYRNGCYGPSGILPATTVGRAVNSVHVGPGKTRVELFWVDPDDTQKPPWKPPPTPEG